MGLQVFFPISFRGQPPEVFYDGGCSWGFCGIHGRALVPGFFFDKVAGLRHAALLKGRLWRGYFFCVFFRVLQDFSGRIFYIVSPENWFCLLLKRIENGFSNSHFPLITSFLRILMICKFPWTHGMGFNGSFLLCAYYFDS